MLELRWETDGDGTGELFVAARTHGFSGHSSAWFGEADLQKNADAFAAFPLPDNPPPEIIGGYWGNGGAAPSQVLVGIRATPLNSTGRVCFRVLLACDRLMNDDRQPRFRAELDVETTYEELRRFPDLVKSLINGEINAFVLGENLQWS